MTVSTTWRGEFDNHELHELHAEAFGTRLYSGGGWNWRGLVEQYSFGWAVARHDDTLVGFVNVISDGAVHAWIQDVMVAESLRRQGVGRELVACAAEHARDVGCEWLHVDFEPHLEAFYLEACGFSPTSAGLLRL